jgi:hypothetical protein
MDSQLTMLVVHYFVPVTVSPDTLDPTVSSQGPSAVSSVFTPIIQMVGNKPEQTWDLNPGSLIIDPSVKSHMATIDILALHEV